MIPKIKVPEAQLISGWIRIRPEDWNRMVAQVSLLNRELMDGFPVSCDYKEDELLRTRSVKFNRPAEQCTHEALIIGIREKSVDTLKDVIKDLAEYNGSASIKPLISRARSVYENYWGSDA